MSIRKIWKTKESNDITQEQIQACGNNRLIAVLLNNRGIKTPVEIKKFLNPLKSGLLSPDVFNDMQKVLTRIKSAISANEHITIYGDFDADGITSTAILFLTLKEIGADVDYYIPDRSSESHGLNSKALVKIISKSKSKLILTVDCGISNINEINFAKSFKTDIIITDHHEAPDILPEAFAIINPKAPESINSDLSVEEIQSLNNLAGAGVAFKLACKLLEEYKKEDFVNEILPLCAIGTIGDVVNLTGENRSIVAMGLELIKHGRHNGIQKLISSAGISDITKISAETIAFSIVPRLNAAGRLESPLTALKILISVYDENIETNIKLLNDLNILRQNLCDETFFQAKQMYENNKLSNKKSIILFNENWHIGIIGIVSSRLVEEYNKPVLLMTRDTNFPEIIRCSSRSIKDINLFEVLSEHKEYFEGFGGHKMAAGFSFNEKKISLESLKKLINNTIEEASIGVDFSKTVVEADMIVVPNDLTINTVENINKLEPFGSGNPSPLFIMNDLIFKTSKLMGQNENHLKIFASDESGQNLECIKWNSSNINLFENSKFNILFSPRINSFNGNTSVQYILEDLQYENQENEPEITDVKILDHRNKKDILLQVLDFINSTKKQTGIFLSTPKLLKQIENSKALNLIINTENIQSQTEQLMFFECPADKDDFFSIIKNSNAKIVHLMNFNIQKIITDNFISTLSGMLKYALTNLGGNIEIKKLANALTVNEKTLDCALDLLSDTKMINYEQISETEYNIKTLNPVELSKIKQSDLYNELNENINEINDFRQFYLNATPDEIKQYL